MKFEQSLEMHLLKECREKYRLNDLSVSPIGKTQIEGNYQILDITENINHVKREISETELFYKSSDLNALALLEKINHYLIRRYLLESDNLALKSSLNKLNDHYGNAETDKILSLYNEAFSNTIELDLDGNFEEMSMRERLLEEVILLKVCNSNRAADPYKELFDDKKLTENSHYTPAFYTLLKHFDTTPSFGNQGENLIQLLLEPAQKHPESLQAQIEYIKEMWTFLTDDFLLMLMRGIDLLKEENKMFFSGPGPTAPVTYGHGHSVEEEDNPNYSPDSTWMPEVILLAKNTLVWLNQLSRDYGREIKTLNQIPDEELDIIASRGINCLWLIGIWNRSNASKEIKKRCGNDDAVSSAYSLFSYDISWEIGGWDALINLKERCWNKGIRLASDMVPNHTGIDSEWTRSRPDWFVQTDRPPFPSYRYESENLSEDPGIGIYLEDHYYDKSDAAVTFKRVNFHTGETRFIYHGNDGTSMPWNDTAQLDFLKEEVREAVIQQILHVARNFPVIRFDAAMTLAKKHIQRLWYPKPGHGGDIASRSNFALSQDAFDAAIGGEFWKEVVNRVASEAPDTLLLAEAFWMMEGYFVRNLGMHRVYNSAFMNMLKKEENGKYKETIKNTLNYDRKILKRFVNFMNNPDEETAAIQFGTGDKYFGVMTLMLTMPGLPMVGHGQVEGYREKYGMEFHKPLWDEYPDQGLVDRHEKEIFPLMQKRYLFVSANQFRLFDLYDNHGHMNDNVYAYSNKSGRERTLVLYNNAYENAVGTIHQSAGYIEHKDGSSAFESNSLGEALGLTNDYEHYCLLREIKTETWYIRNSREIYDNGLFIHLDGYESQVFVDIHELKNSDSNYIAAIAEKLDGKGTKDLDREYREMIFKPLYKAFDLLVNEEYIEKYLKVEEYAGFFKEIASPLSDMLEGVKEFSGGQGEIEEILLSIKKSFLNLETAIEGSNENKLCREFFLKGLSDENKIIIYLFSLFRYLGYLISATDGEKLNREIMENWMIDKYFKDKFQEMKLEDSSSEYIIAVLKFFFERLSRIKGMKENPLSKEYINKLLDMKGFYQLMGLNSYDGILWFSRERFREYLWWWFYNLLISRDVSDMLAFYKEIEKWQEASEKSEYDFNAFLELI